MFQAQITHQGRFNSQYSGFIFSGYTRLLSNYFQYKRSKVDQDKLEWKERVAGVKL